MLKLDAHRFFRGVIVTVLGALSVLLPATANAGSFALNEQSVSGLGNTDCGREFPHAANT